MSDIIEHVDLIKPKSLLEFEPTTDGIKLIVLQKLINFVKTHKEKTERLKSVILPKIEVLEETEQSEVLKKIKTRIKERGVDFKGREYFIVREVSVENNGHRFLIGVDYSNKKICIIDAFVKNHNVQTLENGWQFVVSNNKLQYNSGACEAFAYYLPFAIEKIISEDSKCSLESFCKKQGIKEIKCISESLFSNPAATSLEMLKQYKNNLVTLFSDICPKDTIEGYCNKDRDNIQSYLDAVKPKAPKTEVLMMKELSSGTSGTKVIEERRSEEKAKRPKGGFIFHSQCADAEWLKGLAECEPAKISTTKYQKLLEAKQSEFEAESSQLLQQKKEPEQSL